MTRAKLLLITVLFSTVIVLPCAVLVLSALISPTLFRHVLNPSGRIIYGYNSNTENVGGVAVNESRKTVLYGDVEQLGEYCDFNSQYYCVKGAGFHFAVPRNFDSTTAAWTVSDYTYQVRTKEQIEDIDGHMMKVVVIDSKESPTFAWTYYYSHDWGLLAFEQKVDRKIIRREVVSCFGFGGIESGSLFRYLFNQCWNTDTTRGKGQQGDNKG